MPVSIRPGTRADIRQMAEIGTSATTAEALANWMDDLSAIAAWHVAEDELGALLGFQCVDASAELTSSVCEIATFLRAGVALAVGSRLFEATAEAARLLGYAWIEARVASGNEGARIYYQSRGFRIWNEADGRVLMRYDLD
ncbi:MAG: hypothetical protein AUK37_03155 [Rhodobacterales bacterium CG2_30_65_12]|nr:MAG: hypothetical protein AUK37_03155 [Rhodobacterales bacterium CG2_30_65_12]